LYALEHNVASLQRDHELAHALAESLLNVAGLEVVGGAAHTNMVYIKVNPRTQPIFLQACASRGLLFTGSAQYRLVVHRDIQAEMIDKAVEIIRDCVEAA